MQHYYVKDGQIVAKGMRAVQNAMLADGKGWNDDNWFKTTGTAAKKAEGVYEGVPQDADPQPDFVNVVRLAAVYDAGSDTVTEPFALQEWPLEQARTAVKRRITEDQYHPARDKGVTVNGDLIATTNDARQELAAAVEKTAGGGTQKAVTRSGVPINLDTAGYAAVLAVVDAHRAACNDREHDLYILADAAATVADLRAIDIEAGWPT